MAITKSRPGVETRNTIRRFDPSAAAASRRHRRALFAADTAHNPLRILPLSAAGWPSSLTAQLGNAALVRQDPIDPQLVFLINSTSVTE